MKKTLCVLGLLLLISFQKPVTVEAGWFERNTYTHVYNQVTELGPFSISSDYSHTVVHCAGLSLHCSIDKPYVTKFTKLQRLALKVF